MPRDRPGPADQPGQPTTPDQPAVPEMPRTIPFSDGSQRTWDELELAPDTTSAWQRPGVAEHPDRPKVDHIRLPSDRLAHILDGDEQGGGHLNGTGIPGKTEFPESWDDDQIARAVLRAAHRPQNVEQQNNGRWRVSGIYDDVDMRVIVHPDGRIWSAHPIAGPGVTTNPDQ